jgi:hypothetical protein
LADSIPQKSPYFILVSRHSLFPFSSVVDFSVVCEYKICLEPSAIEKGLSRLKVQYGKILKSAQHQKTNEVFKNE